MTPNWTRAETPMMPKGRYKIMTAYMPKVGRYGLDMMYRTCTVQTNLDFSSEADMVKKLRVSLALQPVATALFANSPFTEGKPNGFLSFRSEIWRDTDNRAPACCRWRSRTAWASSAMSTTRSTCRCISSSARTSTSTSSGLSFRDLLAASCPATATCAPRSRTGRTTSRRFSRGAAEALSRDARRRSRAVARLPALPAFWVGLLYDDARSMPHGTS
jgi:glutamate--cysteine ligase